MSEQKFLLLTMPTTTQGVKITDDPRAVIVSQENHFPFDASHACTLQRFLEGVKADNAAMHHYSDELYIYSYEPRQGVCEVVIVHKSTGRVIVMDLSTAYKLLDALTGKTERLIKDEALKPVEFTEVEP